MKADQFEDESLLRLAAIEIYEEAAREYEEMAESGEEVRLSQQQVDKRWKQVMKQYRQEEKRRKRKPRREHSPKRLLRVASVAIAAFLSVGTVASATPTIREMVLEDFGKYTSVHLLFSGSNIPRPDGWTEIVYPTYIPKDFSFVQIARSDIAQELLYKNEANDILGFAIFSTSANVDVNTENMIRQEVCIDEHMGVAYSSMDDTDSVLILNYLDCVVCISGPIPMEEAIKIAKSISN